MVLIMTLQCNHCNELFLSNHALYKHKSLAHPKSSLLSDENPQPAKRPAEVGGNEISKYRKIEPATLPPVAVNKSDLPEEKLTDLVSKPELLSIGTSSLDRENDVVSLKSDCYITTSKSSNSSFEESHDEEKLIELQEEYKNKIRENQEYHDKLIADLKITYEKKLREYEENCSENIKLLHNQFQALQGGEEDTGNLTMTIFNFSAIGEILEIQRLIKNRQTNKVLEAHFPMLKKMLLGLSFGVLPLCQPQRSRVTDEQRVLVEQLQSASKASAKRILREKEASIIRLFEIIKHSLKFAASSFNHFSTL